MALVAALEPWLLKAPRVLQASDHGARKECVDRLAHPAAGRILGSGTRLMAAVVLDVEVSVERLRQCDLGQPALHLLLLVPGFVGGVGRCRPPCRPSRREACLVEDRRGCPRPQPRRPRSAPRTEGQERLGDPAVVLVGSRVLMRGRQGVRAVQSGDQVQTRDEAQDRDRSRGYQKITTGRGRQRPPTEREEGHARGRTATGGVCGRSGSPSLTSRFEEEAGAARKAVCPGRFGLRKSLVRQCAAGSASGSRTRFAAGSMRRWNLSLGAPEVPVGSGVTVALNRG